MSAAGRLEEYRRKRDFRSTPEPSGGESRGQLFAIQKHDASRLHYDFRLEADGVLKSWAVPKGPSTDPGEKRLAIPTEDHPVDYLEFEGTIPENEYGGGAVLVWDSGSYTNQTTGDDGRPVPMADAISNGHVSFSLSGQKISGGYSLIRTGLDDTRWLLIKKDDKHADARRNPTSTEPESVISGLTLTEISEQAGGGERAHS